MRIVSLQPFATDVLNRFGGGWELVGIPHVGDLPPNASQAEVITKPLQQQIQYLDSDARRLAEGLSRYPLEVGKLRDLVPDVILADVREPDRVAFISWAEGYLERQVGRKVVVRDISIEGLESMYDVIEELGALVGNRVDARRLASTIKAQLMAWADSFFDRCRGKQVAVISSLDPMTVEGRWFPDLIKLVGARTVECGPERDNSPVRWDEIVAARTDVLIIAPENQTLAQSVKSLSILQSLPGWETVPAVRRGEVIFAAGTDLYRPGPRFLKGAAIVVSAIAGLDSGYITERDEYFKVRYLELHRHKFLC